MAKNINFKGKIYNSEVSLSLSVLGGKWKMPIIWHLRENAMRYGAIKAALPSITHKMLTQQLRELEKDEIIIRKVYSQVPPKVEYSLTLLGGSTLPVIEMLIEWGKEYRKIFD